MNSLVKLKIFAQYDLNVDNRYIDNLRETTMFIAYNCVSLMHMNTAKEKTVCKQYDNCLTHHPPVVDI